MVYYDGTDYLVGGEVLKDLSGFTLKMADAFVDTPKDNDREVNIHAMDFKHEDAQLVHVPSQNQCCSTLPLLFRPDSGVYMASNVAPENIMVSASIDFQLSTTSTRFLVTNSFIIVSAALRTIFSINFFM